MEDAGSRVRVNVQWHLVFHPHRGVTRRSELSGRQQRVPANLGRRLVHGEVRHARPVGMCGGARVRQVGPGGRLVEEMSVSHTTAWVKAAHANMHHEEARQIQVERRAEHQLGRFQGLGPTAEEGEEGEEETLNPKP